MTYALLPPPVSTGMGLKEWIFYARTREQFLDEFNQLLAGHPGYPIEIEFAEDPAWRFGQQRTLACLVLGRNAQRPDAQPRQPARDRVANYDSRGAGWRRLQR